LVNKQLLANIQFQESILVRDTLFELPLRDSKFYFFSPKYDDYNAKFLSGSLSEPKTHELFIDIMLHAKYFLDVGAYTGIYTLIAKKSNSSSFVWCFEPNPSAIKILESNIFLNKFNNVEIIQAALSDIDGFGILNTPKNLQKGHSSASLNNNFSDLNIVSLNINVLRLDSLVFKKADVIKVDIEDSEINFIKGAKETLLKFSPILFIECLNRKRLSNTRKALAAVNYTHYIKIGNNFGDERNYCFFNISNTKYATIRDFCIKYNVPLRII
jgi:FkbM family methyltransferase